MVNKPQYNLVVRKGTAYVDYFSSANMSTNPELAILWSRIKSNSKSLAETNKEVEQGGKMAYITLTTHIILMTN